MSDGAKKYATYIMDQFQRKVNEFDQNQNLTDCFFFDSASNVQTSVQILYFTYPQAMVFMEGGMLCPCFSQPLHIHPNTG